MPTSVLDPRIARALEEAQIGDRPYKAESLNVNDDVPLWCLTTQYQEVVTNRAVHGRLLSGVEVAYRTIGSAALAPLICMQLVSCSRERDNAGDFLIGAPPDDAFAFRVSVGGRVVTVTTELGDSFADDDANDALARRRTRALHGALTAIDTVILTAEEQLAVLFP